MSSTACILLLIAWHFIQIAVLEEQNDEDEKAEDETKENDTPVAAGPSSETKITEEFDSKPDVNDVPMEDNQVKQIDLNC